mgnify:FL=1
MPARSLNFAQAALLDKKTAALDVYRIKSTGKWAEGLEKITAGVRTRSYNDQIQLYRADNAAFTFNGNTATSHTILTGKTNVVFGVLTVIEPDAVKPARWDATIADTGAVDQNATDAAAMGYNAMREWYGWDAITGALTDPNDIAKSKAYIVRKMRVLACLTPQVGKASVVYPALAVAAIADAKFDPAWFELGVINESHWGSYWPGRNVFTAWDTAVRVKADLPLLQIYGPSWTWDDAPSLETMIQAVEAKGYLDKGIGLDLHCYPRLGNVDACKTKFTNILKLGRKYADKHGIPFAMSEYGCYAESEASKKDFPAFTMWQRQEVKGYTGRSAYYIMRCKPEDAHYGLHLIDAAGKRTALGTAVAQAASPIS